jgi:hypothetical protein
LVILQAMSLIHLIVGDATAKPLSEAVTQDEALAGEIVILKDILNVGPLKTEGMTFSESRSAFWTEVVPEGQPAAEVDDLERLMALSSRLSNDASLNIWFWMAPRAADVCAYFWLLQFLKKHQGRFSVININGLPFLDENGKLFYPESFGDVPVKEIIKARKLARVITPSEWETDGDEWQKMVTENSGLRKHEAGKKLSEQSITFYDDLLLSLCTKQNQKAIRVVNQAMSKNKIQTGDWFLLWRLRTLTAQGKLEMQKGDVKLKSENSETAPETTEDNATQE